MIEISLKFPSLLQVRTNAYWVVSIINTDYQQVSTHVNPNRNVSHKQHIHHKIKTISYRLMYKFIYNTRSKNDILLYKTLNI